MNWIEQITNLLVEADKIAVENGVDNLFYNEMYIELNAASKLGHLWSAHTQGGDALEPGTNKPTEYKFINERSKSKGSFQFHWLSNHKMNELRKTDNMYFGLRDGVNINKIYKLPTSVLIPHIEQKATNSDKTDGHKSFSLKNILNMGAELVYESKKEEVLDEEN
jgi:hypothetical protein